MKSEVYRAQPVICILDPRRFELRLVAPTVSPCHSLTGFEARATVVPNAAARMIPTFETGADRYLVSRSSDMDQADRDIFQVLQVDGRMPSGQIGRRVGLSVATVRRRVDRMRRQGIITVMAVPNLARLGYAVTALFGLQTTPGLADAVAETVAQFEETQVVAVTTGHYDVFIWAGFRSTQDLHGFMNDKLAAVDGVVRSESFINLSIKQTPYGKEMKMQPT